jgi:hypothetical protein
MNWRDDGDGARWNMLNNEGGYHQVVSQNKKEFVYKELSLPMLTLFTYTEA